MLSKIIEKKKIEPDTVKKFLFPSPKEMKVFIEKKKESQERENILNKNKDDPLEAARKEANKMLGEAQEKLKEAEIQGNMLVRDKLAVMKNKMESQFQEKLESETRNLKENYLNTLEELAKLREIIYKKNENEFMNLVFSIVKKIVGEEVKTSPDVVLTMLKKGFEKTSKQEKYEIKINPLDYEILLKNRESLKEITDSSGNINFIKDETIERGGCRIITETGEISSEPHKQLEVIVSEMSDAD